MAATKSKIMRVSVTNGDAINENRLKGKSNTGTYFICSSKQYDDFKEFIEQHNKYFIDKKKVYEYLLLFKIMYFKDKELYIDKMEYFEDYCHSLINSSDKAFLDISFRKNDSRYFLKFNNNDDIFAQSLRHILYGERSNLCFEIINDKCYIYPEVVFDLIDDKKGENDIIYID